MKTLYSLILASVTLFSALVFAEPIPSPFPTLNQPSEAKITLVEFSDFQCPFCKRAATTVIPQVLKEYSDSVQIVYRNFPLEFHSQAMNAAIAGICAQEQGKFTAMYEQIFSNQETLTASSFMAFAASTGLDANAFQVCMESAHARHSVEMDLADGLSFGVNSVPTFFINGDGKSIRINGVLPYERFKAAIDSILNPTK